jgi:hypothetical protein
MPNLSESQVECAVAMIWPEGRCEPLCEMYRTDLRTMRWSSKHFSDGSSFLDGGRLYSGETARSLAETGTGSGLHRYLPHTPVTFVVARIDVAAFDKTSPTDWTLEEVKALPDAAVTKYRADDGR